MENHAGLGIYGPNCRTSQGLGTHPSVFQAEILAIHYCAQIIQVNGIRGKNLYILSDSQAALKSLKRPVQTSKIVLECREELQELARYNKLTLMWVPGHRGVEGNEKADELARKGSATPFIGPEPFCALPSNALLEPVKAWESRRLSHHWISVKGLKQAKRLISPFSYGDILKYSKMDLRMLTGLLTGHCGLRYHMNKLGLSNEPTCRLCLEEDETSEHILYQCEAIARLRMRFLGGSFFCPQEFQQVQIGDILRFIKNLDIL